MQDVLLVHIAMCLMRCTWQIQASEMREGSTAHGSMTLVSTTAERTPSNGSACTHVSIDAAHSYGLRILVSQQNQRPWLIGAGDQESQRDLPARPWTSEPLQLTWTYSVKARRVP